MAKTSNTLRPLPQREEGGNSADTVERRTDRRLGEYLENFDKAADKLIATAKGYDIARSIVQKNLEQLQAIITRLNDEIRDMGGSTGSPVSGRIGERIYFHDYTNLVKALLKILQVTKKGSYEGSERQRPGYRPEIGDLLTIQRNVGYTFQKLTRAHQRQAGL